MESRPLASSRRSKPSISDDNGFKATAIPGWYRSDGDEW